MKLKVQAKRCRTCIYGPNTPVRRSIEELEDEVRDPAVPGHFRGHRICHHSDDVCCRGFWNRYKDHFDLGQIAQRIDAVEFVDVDTLDPERRDS